MTICCCDYMSWPDQSVTAVAVDDGPCHYVLYLRAWTLEPIGVVIIHDSNNEERSC
jgi:hypothetical protein